MKYGIAGLLILSLSLVGCTGGMKKVARVPVKGKLYVDGEVKGDVALQFTPVKGGTDNPNAFATVKSDGTFVVGTYEDTDGAKPGEYIVTASATSEESEGSTDPAKMMSMMGGGGISTKPANVKIPSSGSENLEIKLESENKKQKQGSTLIGT